MEKYILSFSVSKLKWITFTSFYNTHILISISSSVIFYKINIYGKTIILFKCENWINKFIRYNCIIARKIIYLQHKKYNFSYTKKYLFTIPRIISQKTKMHWFLIMLAQIFPCKYFSTEKCISHTDKYFPTQSSCYFFPWAPDLNTCWIHLLNTCMI